MQATASPQRRYRPKLWLLILIWLGIGAITTGIVVATTWLSLQSRGQAIEATQQDVANVTRILEHNVARAFDAADLLTRAVASRFEHLHHDDGRSALWAMVSEMTAELPQIKGVTVLDAQTGAELFGYADFYPALREIVDEAFFTSGARDGRKARVTLPAYNPVIGEWLVGVSRHIPIETEPYDLIVVAHVSLDYFKRVFNELSFGSEGSVTLFRRDGVLLARRPEQPERIGKAVSTASVFREQRPKASAGTYEAPAVSVGIVRIFG